jgi:hypothetical protein
MKKLLIICLAIQITACNNTPPKSAEIITNTDQQNSLFRNLEAVTKSTLPDSIKHDSLAFLVLPLEASCPACRNKTIDSIIKYESNLRNNHFIILSANAGRKLMSSYFREHKADLPEMPGKIIYDTTDQADKYSLYKNNPAIYYSYNSKVFKKVWALPTSIKQDLHEFFSGKKGFNAIVKND